MCLVYLSPFMLGNTGILKTIAGKIIPNDYFSMTKTSECVINFRMICLSSS